MPTALTPDELIREPAAPADTYAGLATSALPDVRTVLDPDYPAFLHQVFARPPLLFLRGTWREENDWRSVAVVGSRQASPAPAWRAKRAATDAASA